MGDKAKKLARISLFFISLSLFLSKGGKQQKPLPSNDDGFLCFGRAPDRRRGASSSSSSSCFSVISVGDVEQAPLRELRFDVSFFFDDDDTIDDAVNFGALAGFSLSFLQPAVPPLLREYRKCSLLITQLNWIETTSETFSFIRLQKNTINRPPPLPARAPTSSRTTKSPSSSTTLPCQLPRSW